MTKTSVEKKLLKCRICGKKRKLGVDGMCGKCLQESGAPPEGMEDEACLGEGEAVTTEQVAEAQAALDAEGDVIELGPTKEQAPKVPTIFGEALGYPEIPKEVRIKFRKRLPQDELTPAKNSLLAVATTEAGKDKMMVEARNGKRLLRLERAKAKDGATLYGVYAY